MKMFLIQSPMSMNNLYKTQLINTIIVMSLNVGGNTFFIEE